DGNYLAAWEHDGTLKWTSTVHIGGEFAIALADLDADGDVEIIFGNKVTDHEGNLVFTAGDVPPPWATTTAADLDADGDLEVVMGRSAWHHDGTMMWMTQGAPAGAAHGRAKAGRGPRPRGRQCLRDRGELDLELRGVRGDRHVAHLGGAGARWQRPRVGDGLRFPGRRYRRGDLRGREHAFRVWRQ